MISPLGLWRRATCSVKVHTFETCCAEISLTNGATLALARASAREKQLVFQSSLNPAPNPMLVPVMPSQMAVYVFSRAMGNWTEKESLDKKPRGFSQADWPWCYGEKFILLSNEQRHYWSPCLLSDEYRCA